MNDENNIFDDIKKYQQQGRLVFLSDQVYQNFLRIHLGQNWCKRWLMKLNIKIYFEIIFYTDLAFFA